MKRYHKSGVFHPRKSLKIGGHLGMILHLLKIVEELLKIKCGKFLAPIFFLV